MTFDQALEQVVKEGAIRLWRVSRGWALAYRIHNGKLQARSLNRVGESDNWKLSNRLSGTTTHSPDGWHHVLAIHERAQPIELEAAKGNPGYYLGLTRQCGTCRKVKPLSEFERDMTGEQGYRTWECNQCASERAEKLAKRTRIAARV